MYLTVSRGNVSENTDHSWKEINNYSVYDYDTMGVERYQAAALLQVGDEDGPQQGAVGYGAVSYTHLDVYKRQVSAYFYGYACWN